MAIAIPLWLTWYEMSMITFVFQVSVLDPGLFWGEALQL